MCNLDPNQGTQQAFPLAQACPVAPVIRFHRDNAEEN